MVKVLTYRYRQCRSLHVRRRVQHLHEKGPVARRSTPTCAHEFTRRNVRLDLSLGLKPRRCGFGRQGDFANLEVYLETECERVATEFRRLSRTDGERVETLDEVNIGVVESVERPRCDYGVWILAERSDPTECLGRSFEKHVAQPHVDAVGDAVRLLDRNCIGVDCDEAIKGRLMATEMQPTYRPKASIGI